MARGRRICMKCGGDDGPVFGNGQMDAPVPLCKRCTAERDRAYKAEKENERRQREEKKKRDDENRRQRSYKPTVAPKKSSSSRSSSRSSSSGSSGSSGGGGAGGTIIAILMMIALVVAVVQWVIAMVIAIIPFVIAGIVIYLLIKKFGFVKSIKYIFITVGVAVLALFMLIRHNNSKYQAQKAKNEKQRAELNALLEPFKKGLSRSSSVENPDVKSIVGEHKIHRLRMNSMDAELPKTLSDKDASVHPFVVTTSKAPQIFDYVDLENQKYGSIGQTITIKSTYEYYGSDINCSSIIDKIDKYNLFTSTTCMSKDNEIRKNEFGIIEVDSAVGKKLKFDTPVDEYLLPKENRGLWKAGAACTKEMDEVVFVGGNSIVGRVAKEDSIFAEDVYLFGIQKVPSESKSTAQFTALSKASRYLSLCVLNVDIVSKKQQFSVKCSTDYQQFITDEGFLPEGKDSSLNLPEDLNSRKTTSEFKFTLCSPMALKKPPKRQNK